MNGTDMKERDAATLWKDICQAAPALLSAHALKSDGSVITSRWSQRDVIAARKRTLVQTHARVDGSNYVTGLPADVGACDEFISPSRKHMVRFVEKPNDEGTEISVWALGNDNFGSSILSVWTVREKMHGRVFSDEWFGGVAWSPDENLFIYIADRPKKIEFEEVPEGVLKKSWIDSLRSKYDGASRDVLGEGYVGKRSPAMFLADVTLGECRTLCPPVPGVPESENHDLYGSPVWSPDGAFVAVTRRPTALTESALEEDGLADNPYTLGVRYCYNRYSSVEAFVAPKSLDDSKNVLETLTPISDHKFLDDYCCISPRISPDSNLLVYLSAPRTAEGRAKSVTLPHATTKVLRAAHVSVEDGGILSAEPVTMVDVVDSPQPNEFPGLYLHSLPSRTWTHTSNGMSLLASSTWGSAQRVLRISIDTDNLQNKSKVSDVTPVIPDMKVQPSVSLMDICPDGSIVVSASSPMHPTALFYAKCAEKGVEAIAASHRSEPSGILEHNVLPFECTNLMLAPTRNNMIDASVAAIPYDKSKANPSERFQATLLIPRCAETKAVPLVVYPHGGPHSVSLNSFSAGVAAMLLSGLAVLHTNYRGSLGLGQASLRSLPGLAGSQDVAEVLQATQWALQNNAELLDKERVGYVGGSHGGFLGAHVSMVEGNPFKTVCLRNPVTNIASMVGVTDIPEWGFCEAGVSAVSPETGLALCADPTALEKMWRASPVARVRKGGPRPAPTTLFVGSEDRRVPPSQSIEWHRVITEAFGAGIVTLRWYPGNNHSIDKVPDGDDVWVHSLELLSRMK